MRTPPALRVELRRSRIAAGLIITALLFTQGSLLFSRLDPATGLVLSCGLMLCAGWQWRALSLPPWTTPDRIEVLAWSAGQGWRLRLTGDTDWQDAELLPGGVVHPWCCGLQFRLCDGSRRNLLLFPDSSDAESLRRLRVLWRFGLEPVDARQKPF